MSLQRKKYVQSKELSNEEREKRKAMWRAQYEKYKDPKKKSERGKRYYQKYKEKIKAKSAETYSLNPDRHRWSRLKNQYNISEEQYNNLFVSQNESCAICYKHQSQLNQKLSVDHCHATGKVRGLLCKHCNHALGKFEDNIQTLQSAIKYLTYER